MACASSGSDSADCRKSSWRCPATPQLHLPVLLVHDAADDVVPFDHSAQLARRLPDASLITTHGLGHSGPLRDPATLTAIADFLDAV
jgi:pimeloyl-ACP methyl ester carboxylesterase